ncbi:dihydrofolate reductase family protein [Enterococcus sp. DIV1258]|uniref:dihydrofolate reductase family protein n=1 Tax=Enterococcus sp. DIV1258 TaxID=2774824 RepID=UPI003F68792C
MRKQAKIDKKRKGGVDVAREVILFIAASIDGFIADKAGGVAWLEENIRGDEEDRSYDEMYEKIDTVVMGRTTYDQVTQELSPDVYFYEDKHSYIITSHPEPSTASRTFTKEDPVTLIRRLKEEDGAGIWIVGGPKVVQPLLVADLIDTFILTTIPLFLGEGIALYETMAQSIPVRLKQVYQKNELVYSIYQRENKN